MEGREINGRKEGGKGVKKKVREGAREEEI